MEPVKLLTFLSMGPAALAWAGDQMRVLSACIPE